LGLVHAANAAASIRHSNVLLASVEWNTIEALVVPTAPLGPESMTVSGAVLSIRHPACAGD